MSHILEMRHYCSFVSFLEKFDMLCKYLLINDLHGILGISKSFGILFAQEFVILLVIRGQ